MTYENAVKFIKNRRRAELDDAYTAFIGAIRADDELFAAFSAYQLDMINSARGEKNTLAKTQAAYEKLLKAKGLSTSALEPPPHCKLCNDSGVVGGKYCKCVVRYVISSDSANLTLKPVDFNKAKATAPKAISAAYTAAEEYITCDKPFFMLFGDAGTGKTVLASAIATEMMERGASVVTVTAFDFVRRALEYHTQFKIDDYVDRFTPMLDCDLLVLDDLGKETMLKNVTLEYLYAVINERWAHKKKTIVTSNLKPEAAIARYGESVASRMFDKAASYNFIVSGKNARLSD